MTGWQGRPASGLTFGNTRASGEATSTSRQTKQAGEVSSGMEARRKLPLMHIFIS